MSSAIQKIRVKYMGMSAPVKAAFWFTVCSFLQRGISMITTPIFTRLFTEEEYGLYSTYISWESVFLLIVTLTLNKAMMNLYVKYDDKEGVLSAVCGLEFTLSLAWGIAGIIFREQLAKILGISPVLVCCLFFYCFSQSMFQCWSLYNRYIYNYKTIVGATLLSTIGTSLLAVLSVLFIAPTADSRAIATTIVLTLIGIVLYVDIIRKGKKFYDGKVWMFALGFCVPLMPHYLSEFILQSSDKIMINYLCGSRDVALFSVAFSAGSLINLVTNAINSTFAPYQYQKIQAGEYTLLAKRANQVLIFVGVMLAGIMLFSKEIVLIFGGMKYVESVEVIIPICIGIFFNYTFQLFARVQEYYERKLTVVLPSILCAVLNIILNYTFISLIGYQAAAYTTFFCYAFFCLVHYFSYRKVCREILEGKQLYDAKGILLISIGVTVTGMLIMFVNTVLWLKYSLIVLLAIGLVIFRKKAFNYVIGMLSK